MLEDIKFDLQTLDYRALGESEWAELKYRLERRAHADRSQAMRVMTGAARTRFGGWLGRLGSALIRDWQAYLLARRRRMNVVQLTALDDRVLKDIGLRRCEIYSAVYRDPNGFR